MKWHVCLLLEQEHHERKLNRFATQVLTEPLTLTAGTAVLVRWEVGRKNLEQYSEDGHLVTLESLSALMTAVSAPNCRQRP